MVNIVSLTEEDIGRWVVYTPTFDAQEKGRIKSWNDKYVFVVYRCDFQWDRFQDFTGCATDPENLHFIKLLEKLKNGKIAFELEKMVKEYTIL